MLASCGDAPPTAAEDAGLVDARSPSMDVGLDAELADAPPGEDASGSDALGDVSSLPDSPSDVGRTFDDAALRALLAANQPGTEHEALPHGVPDSYDWYARSRADPSRSDVRLTSLNWWAQVYADTSGIRPANTRVAVRGGVVLLLFEGESTWQEGQRTDVLAGGSWSEDFQSYPCGTFDMRTEPDMSRSFVPDANCAAHFWPDVAHVDIGTRPLRAVVSVAHTRLVLDDAGTADDRAASRYLIGLGVDWRDPVGGCPTNAAGVPICSGAGVGRMIQPTTAWRAVVFSTMTDADLASLPPPPIAYFQHPDGSWPGP